MHEPIFDDPTMHVDFASGSDGCAGTSGAEGLSDNSAIGVADTSPDLSLSLRELRAETAKKYT